MNSASFPRVYVAPFGAWVVLVVVTTGLHPWYNMPSRWTIATKGGTANTLLKKMSDRSERRLSAKTGYYKHY